MDIVDYQNWVRQGWTTDPSRELTLRDDYIMTAGLGGETGEVLELLKKNVRDGVLDKEELVKELGDVLFYLTMICSRNNITLNEVMVTNVTKLTMRRAKKREQT